MLILIFNIYSTCKAREETTLLIFGHTYPIVDNDYKRLQFINYLTSFNADYIISLGDSDIEFKQVADLYKKTHNTFLSVPGNHEVMTALGKKKDYIII